MSTTACNRCGGTESTPVKFLLTCCVCSRNWHHRCHVPPVEDADLLQMVRATNRNDVDNGLVSWACKRCARNRDSVGVADSVASSPFSRQLQSTSASQSRSVLSSSSKEPSAPPKPPQARRPNIGPSSRSVSQTIAAVKAISLDGKDTEPIEVIDLDDMSSPPRANVLNKSATVAPRSTIAPVSGKDNMSTNVRVRVVSTSAIAKSASKQNEVTASLQPRASSGGESLPIARPPSVSASKDLASLPTASKATTSLASAREGVISTVNAGSSATINEFSHRVSQNVTDESPQLEPPLSLIPHFNSLRHAVSVADNVSDEELPTDEAERPSEEDQGVEAPASALPLVESGASPPLISKHTRTTARQDSSPLPAFNRLQNFLPRNMDSDPKPGDLITRWIATSDAPLSNVQPVTAVKCGRAKAKAVKYKPTSQSPELLNFHVAAWSRTRLSALASLKTRITS